MTNEIETLELIGNQKLLVERGSGSNTLKLISKDGYLSFSICVTSEGAVLHFEGPSLMVQSSGDLAVDARRVAIHGREGVAISSGGNASICAAGDMKLEAQEQDITARLGSVNVQANDDVRVRGERIKLNC
jgi:uncharacterized protein (DUF2345 family)